jgi:hypothetical protein
VTIVDDTVVTLPANMELSTVDTVMLDVADEMDRQETLWGDESLLPDGTGSEQYANLAEHFRNEANKAHKEGRLTWQLILLEEVFEALAETDPVELGTELRQVAAVAVRWAAAKETNGAT